MRYISIIFVYITIITPSFADDGEMKAALDQVQSMLTNPDARNAEAGKTSAGKAALQGVDNLGGDADTSEAVYGLAAKIFGRLVKESGGDAKKMSELLEAAKKNPEAFANKMSDAEKLDLHSLSTKFPAN